MGADSRGVGFGVPWLVLAFYGKSPGWRLAALADENENENEKENEDVNGKQFTMSAERGVATRGSANFKAQEWQVDTVGSGLRRKTTDSSMGAAASRAELRGMLDYMSELEEMKKEYDILLQRVENDEQVSVELQKTLQDKDAALGELQAQLDAKLAMEAEQENVSQREGHESGLGRKEGQVNHTFLDAPGPGPGPVGSDIVAQLAAAQKNTESQLSELRSLIIKEQLGGVAAQQKQPVPHRQVPVVSTPAVGVSDASTGTMNRASADYAGHKPGDVHNYFKNQLSKVAVAKKGDVNFATARASWKSLVGMYPVSQSVQLQLLGYAFTGSAYKVFLVVMADPRNYGCSAEEIWQRMATKLYNMTMVQTQRSKMTAATLAPGESVGDLLERLTELSMGLPEMEGPGGDDALAQRLVDALPDSLQVHALGLSGGLDAKVAALDAIQDKIAKSGKATWKRRPAEAVQAVISAARGRTELEEDLVDAVGGPEFVAAIQASAGFRERSSDTSAQRGMDPKGIEISSFEPDKSMPLGHPKNPVGPNPDKPDDRQFYSTRRQCYGCRRFGHQRTGVTGKQICGWDPV